MHIMPAMIKVKTYAETGSFGADAVTLGSAQLDTASLMKGASLHRQAVALSKIDGGPRDLEKADNKVYTSNGEQVDFDKNKLVMSTSTGDSTTYFVVQDSGNLQRVAYAVQSNLEMGGPPTQFFGVTVNLDTKQYSGQSFTQE